MGPLPPPVGDAIPDPIAAAGEITIGQRAAVHRDIRIGCRLVEPARQQPVVLCERDRLQQPGGRLPGAVLHHRLVDLHLIGARDLLVVRLERVRVGVAVIAGDPPVRRNRTRFEHRTACSRRAP